MSVRLSSSEPAWDVESVRSEFPALQLSRGAYPLIYLDNAASLQRPRCVLERWREFSETSYSNVHRSVHFLSERATTAYESARDEVARWLGAKHREEIIWTSGATEALNLVAHSYGEISIQEGDEILVTRMEHHANFVPWMELARRKKAKLKIVELNSLFRLDPAAVEGMLTDRTKILAISAGSNVLGTKNELEPLVHRAKSLGAVVVVDACQAMAHADKDFLSLPIDFLAFSSHKLGGPGGVGVLWGRKDLLSEMPPYQLGGEMISEVGDDHYSCNELPYKFEAGTPAIAEVVAFAESLRWMSSLGEDKIQAYEFLLTQQALKRLKEIDGLELFGPEVVENRYPIFSFRISGLHPQDLSQFLDSKAICIRTGLHCAEPLHRKFEWGSSARISLSYYNTLEEIDAAMEAIKKAKEYFL